MQVPELRILEGDAFDHDAVRALDQRQARARDADIAEVALVRGRVAQLPEQVPDRPAGAIEGALAGDVQAIAAARIDEGRIEALLEMAFDAGALDREVLHVGRALEDRTLVEMQVHAGLEEQRPADEHALARPR